MLDYHTNQQSNYKKSRVKLDIKLYISFVLKIFPKTKPDADDDEQGVTIPPVFIKRTS